MNIYNVIIPIFLTFSIPTFAATAPMPSTDISGQYNCHGYDPMTKKKYKEIPLEVKKTGSTYHFQWDFTQQKIGTIMGTGFIAKTGFIAEKRGDIISAIFWDSANPKSVGVISYQILPDRSLDGHWTVPGGTLVGDETCVAVINNLPLKSSP